MKAGVTFSSSSIVSLSVLKKLVGGNGLVPQAIMPHEEESRGKRTHLACSIKNDKIKLEKAGEKYLDAAMKRLGGGEEDSTSWQVLQQNHFIKYAEYLKENIDLKNADEKKL